MALFSRNNGVWRAQCLTQDLVNFIQGQGLMIINGRAQGVPGIVSNCFARNIFKTIPQQR